MTNATWVHPQFDPIAVSIGPIAIHWYGLMYLLAFTLVLVLGRVRLQSPAYRSLSMTARDLDDLILYGVFGVILGGRLGYVLFYKPGYFLTHPIEVFAIWQGGMAFHGGLIGVIVAMALFAHRRKKSFLELSDFVAPLVPLGLAAGRLGNFINGELWGRVTDPLAPWAMVFPQSGDLLARHPSQLYQMMFEGVFLFAVLWFFSSRPRPKGAVAGLFLLGYGASRFIAEFAREPDSFLGLGLLPLGLSMGQWLCIPMIALGVVLIMSAYRDKNRSP